MALSDTCTDIGDWSFYCPNINPDSDSCYINAAVTQKFQGYAARDACCSCRGGYSASDYLQFKSSEKSTHCLTAFEDWDEFMVTGWARGYNEQQFRLDSEGYMHSFANDDLCIVVDSSNEVALGSCGKTKWELHLRNGKAHIQHTSTGKCMVNN